MAHSTNNVVTHGLSGRIDLLVFRQRNGKTTVSKRPRRPTTTSTAQLAVRSVFQQAVFYARSVLANEPLRLLYNEKANAGTSAYNLAIADFFRAPEIGDIDVSRYSGKAGDPIRIAASDNFKVTAVKVKIESGDHSLTEEGEAVLQDDGRWLYTTTRVIASPPGSSITVTAFDLPGHFSTKQKAV